MNIKVGDLISTYWAGYYEVTNVIRRWESKKGTTDYERLAYSILGEENYSEDTCGKEINPLITIIQKFTKEGKPVVTKKEKTCDSQFCKPAKEHLEEEIKKLTEVLKQLEDVYKF